MEEVEREMEMDAEMGLSDEEEEEKGDVLMPPSSAQPTVEDIRGLLHRTNHFVVPLMKVGRSVVPSDEKFL